MAVKIKDLVKPASKVVPMVYAYTTPGVTYHDGYIKIGYTEQNVDDRIYQQTHTAGIKAKKEWQGSAVYDDGSGESFRDTDFHVYLRRLGVHQPQDEGNEFFDPEDRNEWFHIGPDESHGHFIKFRASRGVVVDDIHAIASYLLREEQEDAVLQTLNYYNTHQKGEFLWNAKPRFGKTLSVYDVMPPTGDPWRTNGSADGFPTFRARTPNAWQYSRGLACPSRRIGRHIPVNARQVQVHRRRRQELLPFLRHQRSFVRHAGIQAGFC